MKSIFLLSLLSGMFFSAAGSTLFRREVVYTANGKTCKDYLVYDSSVKGKRPVVLVLPEWWGCNSYAHYRADMLADLGYIALAVDMYGNNQQADNPDDAGRLAGPFYKDPELGYKRIQAALDKVGEFPEADKEKIAAVGYCFGGSIALNAAKMGMGLKGVVSFHGGLAGVPAKKGQNLPHILVCHGEADAFVSKEEVKTFRDNLDQAGIKYTFISYPGATHAFTNPESTANGRRFNLPISYQLAADRASWEAMKDFLKTELR